MRKYCLCRTIHRFVTQIYYVFSLWPLLKRTGHQQVSGHVRFTFLEYAWVILITWQLFAKHGKLSLSENHVARTGSYVIVIYKKVPVVEIIRNVDSTTAPSFEITYFYGDVSDKMGHFALNVRNMNTSLLLRRDTF